MKNIVIIGGGAAGMTAAIAAAQNNRQAKVCILEHKEIPGKKILSTGNGRCNFTNEVMRPDCYYSEHPEVIRRVLEKFGREDTLRLFRSLGVFVKSKNGYYYPRSEQAAAVRELFQMRLDRLGVKVCTGMHAKYIEKERTGFRIHASKSPAAEKEPNTALKADKVILACGGKASPALGSDGSGYQLAKSLGHTIVPVVPALVQLRVKNHPLKKAAGVRTEGTVSIYEGKKLLGADTGELQLTAYGISGIPVFQVSRHAAKGIYDHRPVRAELDFLPEITEEEVTDMFRAYRKKRKGAGIAEIFLGMFNKNLIPCLLDCAGIRSGFRAGALDEELLGRLLKTCKHLPLKIEETNGFEHAQVCAGGVELSQIDPETMESSCCPGLYLAGELLDADGICGGYNLQWAWATGYIAGTAAKAE